MTPFRFLLAALLGGCLLLPATAQETLTLQNAIELALANNFNLQISRNNIQAAQVNNHPGAAGMLPTVTLQSSTTGQVNNLSQKFTNGTEIKRGGVLAFNTQFAVNAEWTLFDGFRMYATRQRLKEEVGAQTKILNGQMLEMVRSITELYLEIVKQQQLLNNTDAMLAISDERVQLFKMRFESGLSAKMDYLQAQTDYNTQLSQKYTQLNSLAQAKENLNTLLGRNAATGFAAEDTTLLNAVWALPDTLNTDNNPDVQFTKTQIGITQLQHQEIEAGKYPQVNLSAAYNFNYNRSQAGFSLFNLNTGPVAGINITWNLFNGGAVKRALTINQIAQQSLQTGLEQTRLLLENQWVQARRNIAFYRQQVQLEDQNLATAAENMTISMERLRAGVANSLELREAQRSYEQALMRKTEALYQIKLAELALLYLQGNLLKEK
ncbi:TolC family protein [Sphingobacteriales bacterium UPWRP_1]|nr:hypothetical protein BVG80_03955 [Sphingobacteriales bacterium TSM_CSM]PSJ75723.1 TolC family protein [Sphingobacteriales bacterium UPWRP_1]